MKIGIVGDVHWCQSIVNSSVFSFAYQILYYI